MKKVLCIFAAIMAVMFSFGVNQLAWADDDICSMPDVPQEVLDAAGCGTTTTADTVINNVIEIVLSLLGIVAVGVIIYGGFTYITSQGDSSKVNKGKNIIIYGVAGLIVSLLAYVIVAFVLKTVH